MTSHSLRRLSGSSLIGILLASLASASMAAPTRKTFTLGKSVFTGEPKSICVIKGKWLDGEPFRYEAWSDCPSMRMRRATRAELLASTPHGDTDVVPTTLPARTEIIEFSNAFSRVLLYRDEAGELKEILVGD